MKLRFLFVLALLAATPIASAARIALVNVTIYPSPESDAIRDGAVLIDGERIVRVGSLKDVVIPDDYEVLDRSGRIVVAGFWNSHVHLATPQLLAAATVPDEALEQQLRALFTAAGFTTVFDIASTLGGAVNIRQRIESGEVRGPNILTVGEPFYPPNGTPIYAIEIYRENNLPSAEVTSVENAAARVRQQAEGGANGIKVFTGAIVGGEIGVLPMPVEYLRAITSEAARLDLPVFAHPTNREGLDLAIDHGVGILAHVAPLAGAWDDHMIRRLIARGIALVPTLALFRAHADAATPMDVALDQVRRFSDAGGQILFGTDVGFIEPEHTRHEFELMGRVLTWREILASLTTAPAARFGQAMERGRVEEGMLADLVVLEEDPAANVGAFNAVHETWRSGRVMFRAPGARTH